MGLYVLSGMRSFSGAAKLEVEADESSATFNNGTLAGDEHGHAPSNCNLISGDAYNFRVLRS